mgnify:CR=1 FL=1
MRYACFLHQVEWDVLYQYAVSGLEHCLSIVGNRIERNGNIGTAGRHIGRTQDNPLLRQGGSCQKG